MKTLFDTTIAAAPERTPRAAEASTGPSGRGDLLASLRAAISRLDSLVAERGRLLASISETEQKVADRERELAAAKSRVQAEQIDLALTSEEAPLQPLESEMAAEALTRQVSFLKARVQGLRGKLEAPNRELAAAREQLQGLWNQVRERRLEQSIAEFCAAASHMRGVILQAGALWEALRLCCGQDRVAARWESAVGILFDTVVGDPAKPRTLLIGQRSAYAVSWAEDPRAADLHGEAAELAAAVKAAIMQAA